MSDTQLPCAVCAAGVPVAEEMDLGKVVAVHYVYGMVVHGEWKLFRILCGSNGKGGVG